MTQHATTTALALLLAAAPAAAQELLEKEITIEREIVPELRAATRLNIYPAMERPAMEPVTLPFTDLTAWGTLSPSVYTYEPAFTGPAYAESPWRGFVKAAWSPLATGTLRAGFMPVRSASTILSLGIDGEYLDYTSRGARVKSLTAGARAGLAHRADAGKLDIDARFRFFRRNYPGLEDLLTRGAVSLDLEASWRGTRSAGGFGYTLDARYGLFNFGRRDTAEPVPMRQNSFALTALLDQDINSASRAGVLFGADFLATNHLSTPDDGSKAAGYFTIEPRYTFDNGTFLARAGARVDISINGGANAVHAAPDVHLGYNPHSWLGIALDMGGGERLNPLAGLYAQAPYFTPWLSYGMSHIPFTADLKLRVGPFRAAALELGASYAAANDWLMPAIAGGTPMWTAADLRSLKVSARLTYSYRDILDLAAGFEAVCSDGHRGDWYLWRDRSRQRLEASLAVRPVKRLEITLGYSRHMDRVTACYTGADYAGHHLFAGTGEAAYENLRDLDNLSASVSYRVLDPLTIFARGENLLDNRAYEPFGIPARGASGWVGLTYRF